MAYDVLYRGLFTNTEGVSTILHISDTTSGTSGPTELHLLKVLECELRVASDGEEKTGIKGSRLIVSFLSTDDSNLMTFVEGEDERWLVELFIETTSTPVFSGYLVLDAAKTLYLPNNTFGVELTASDNLGILKELPLRDLTGAVPKGRKSIIQLIAWCLAGTNQQLPIYVIYNLFEQNYNGASHDPFSTLFVEAMTFETEINERDDRYTTLSKIMQSFGCFITLANQNGLYGWWICRVDEMNQNAYRYYSYTYTGSYGSAGTFTRGKTIGKQLPIKLINRDAEILPERKKKYVRQTKVLDSWQEIFCNIDFQRGVSVPVSIPGGAAYTVECWTPGRFSVAPVASPYIRRLFTNGYETERVVVFPVSASGVGQEHYLQSEDLVVNQSDKFNLSIDSRFTTNINDGSGTYRDFVAQVRLYGNDGSRWTLTNVTTAATNESPGDWVLSNSSFSSNRRYLQHVWNGAQDDETQWFTVDVQAKPVPRAGFIRIFLMQSGLYGHVTETHISNVSFDYIPIINGIYQKLTGQYHQVSTSDKTRANVEEEVTISDTQNDNFKGTLFRYNGSAYVRVGNFYNYLTGTGGELGYARFGKYQAYALWNQNNRVIRKFTGSLMGIDSATPTDIPSLLHRFEFQADSDHTNDKYYQLLSYSMNLKNCRWSGTFADVYDTNIGKSYADIYELKYTTN